MVLIRLAILLLLSLESALFEELFLRLEELLNILIEYLQYASNQSRGLAKLLEIFQSEELSLKILLRQL